jgi:MerR family transcriptional regulator, repressor of the yfmOP operon
MNTMISRSPVKENISVQDKTAGSYSGTDLQTKKLLSSEEVCSLLMISKRTLQSYRDRGILPFSQIGRKIYYKASDIDEYLNRHYVKADYQKGGVV